MKKVLLKIFGGTEAASVEIGWITVLSAYAVAQVRGFAVKPEAIIQLRRGFQDTFLSKSSMNRVRADSA